MAGPIQSAFNQILGTATAVAVAGKKAYEHERQASENASAEAKAQAEAESALQKEAQETALEADLVKMGADPESARAFMTARSLGLSTKGFGMIRQKGKYVGSYSTIAERLSKDALADSLSSRIINEEGFAKRVMALGGTRKGRVQALVEASKGGKK
ncbi:MAG: hypothetical protein J6V44_01705 [Methanobrevibacter sp.]|nr:hypothetical protein [Methanobrevibacter sp.]